jgi:hypothetical protein
MSSLRMLAAVAVGALALLVGEAPRAGADPILAVIDVRPILDRHPAIGNSLGLAYSPASDVIFLSHGSDPRGGFIDTIDLSGNLVDELNFQVAYRPESYPTSLSYDAGSGHLFVLAAGVGGDPSIGKVVEMSQDGSTIFGEFTTPLGGGGGIAVRDDGIWQSFFASDTIRHYTRDGLFIEDVSVASSFPGFPGPHDIASSFNGGFLLADPFGRRIVEIDTAGKEIAAVSTAALGGGLAIATDTNTERTFLQVDNDQVYVLSSDFIGVVPEPSTLTEVGIGIMGLVGYGLARRQVSTRI